MTRGRRKIEFHGLFQQNVLGTFSVIRGFADLRDLAAVSVSMPYESSGLGDGKGYQRTLDEAHVEGLKRFLQRGRYRFFPEIILSLRSTGADDPIVSYRKRRASESDTAYVVRVNLQPLRNSAISPIRRIDGNHRLEAAHRLAEELTRSATFKNFATAPFCFVILNSDRPEDDDLAEAMLFNLINSKALPIVSEHSLSVLMQDEGSLAERFNEDPQVYLTRWIRDRVKGWPTGFYDTMGDSPLSRLHATAKVLLGPGGFATDNHTQLEAEAKALFDPLYDLAVRLRHQHETFVVSPAFLPIAAEVYSHHTLIERGPGANTGQVRLLRAERWLRDFALWFSRIGGMHLPLPPDPTLLWKVFKKDYEGRARSVFVAMSFREDQTLKSVRQAIDEAIQQFNAEHPNAPLFPVRVDEQGGASYEIPARIFQEIDQSTLVIADLTDERPNVYCEIGYAKSRGIPFILTFHKKDPTIGPPWDRTDAQGNRVHFDLAAFRYVTYDNPLQLRDLLKSELDALFDQGGST
ncbi:MAG: hypothetical protein AB7G75_30785 [Candidatus Binatia bacterium]